VRFVFERVGRHIRSGKLLDVGYGLLHVTQMRMLRTKA